MSDTRVVIGLDVGGTSSRGRLARGDQLLAEASTTTASISTSGLDAARSILTTLLTELVTKAGIHDVDAVVLGTAGSGSDAADRVLRETVRGSVDARTVAVVNDAELLLPAAGHENGIAIVAGTGMKIFGRHGSAHATAGGWGFLLGDEGSGYWIVREAVRVVLDRVDAGRPVGELGEQLFEALEKRSAEELIEAFHAEPAPAGWARHVPLVLGTDDPARDPLVTAAAAHLARRARHVLARLDAGDELAVVCAGGVLTGSADLVAALAADLHSSHPHLAVEVLREPPVAGAVRLAAVAAGSPPDDLS